jgi:DNA-directed RNA polymerase subunit alpha
VVSLSEEFFAEGVDTEKPQRRTEERRQAGAAIVARLYSLFKEYPADHEGLVVVRELVCGSSGLSRWHDLPEGFTPLEALGFKDARAYNLLMREGINCVEVLVTMTEADLLDIRQFGEGSLDEVKRLLALHQHGLELKKT